MKTQINDQEHVIQGAEDTTMVDMLRETCDLTGTKLVCGAGVCGACTILVDGTPMTSCLLPAQHVVNKIVQTIEYFQAERVHPVQHAFMVHDGLQCGYCTPGFIIESIAFYDRWRAEHGPSEPSRNEVAAALAGHLCRCGAYEGMYAAVQRACAGDFDDVQHVEPARVDALAKVTGQARYTADIHYPNQLVGKILRSPYAHAKISSIDLEPARSLEGVEAAFLMIQPGEKVRYVGQEVAAIAAIDRTTAERALRLIAVEYEQLPIVIDPHYAMNDSSPTIWQPEERKNAPNANEGMQTPSRWHNNTRDNVFNLGNLKAGKARKAFEQAQASDAVFQGQFELAAQIHTALEPHSCVALWQGRDTLTVHVSTQSVSSMRTEIAEHFDLEEDHVTISSEYVGGAFGAKLGFTSEAEAAITLAREAQKPVSVVLDRHEELLVGGYRPAAELDMTMVADRRSGELKGLLAHAKNQSGVGVNSMSAVLMRLTYAHDKIPRELIDTDVITNVAPGKPFRGPGGPVANWALEQSVDQMAHDLDMDPITLRRTWDQNEIRLKVYDWIEQLPAWQSRDDRRVTTGRYRRGIGVSVGFWAYFYDPKAQVEVRVSAEGISVHSAAQDMGNGSRTVLAQAVAEIFGIPTSSIEVEIGHSGAVYGPRSGGSRTTNSLWAPAQEAATKVRDAVVAAYEQKIHSAVVAVGGGVQTLDQRRDWAEVFASVAPQRATAVRGTDKGVLGSLQGLASRFNNSDMAFGSGLAGGAYVCEVEVDTLLGKVRVEHVWGCIAVGKIHVPEVARSQIYGGIIQAIGYTLYEEKILDPQTGHLLTAGLEDYRLPGIGDIPPIEIDFIEDVFTEAKGGGIGLAEIAKVPMPAAIGNAIFHATGWRPYVSPVRPDHVLKGVQA